jgi:riboflavin kinase/FMN adenylyltransferase
MASIEGLPSFGIYATWAYIGGVRFASATNVGVRPHFGGEEVSVETYVMDFEGDLYDQVLRIEFVAKLRDEAKFESLDGLKAQIERDVAQARAALL